MMAEKSERETLLIAAREAARCAYAPFSRFRVGAAVLVATADGARIVTGANVENASYGLTLCAERAALAAACALAPRTPAMTTPTITRIALACIDAPAEAPPARGCPVARAASGSRS